MLEQCHGGCQGRLVSSLEGKPRPSAELILFRLQRFHRHRMPQQLQEAYVLLDSRAFNLIFSPLSAELTARRCPQVEVFGALVAAWMLISCRLYYIQEQKIISSSSSDTLPDDARPLFDKPGRTSSSLATLPYDDEVSRPSSRSSKKGSRGEAYSMSKRRSDSHRSSRASSRSRSRRRDQERERKRDREPRGEYSTRKSSHRSSSKSRRSSQSRAERAYESDSSSESDWDDRGERRRGSGSRRTRRR